MFYDRPQGRRDKGEKKRPRRRTSAPARPRAARAVRAKRPRAARPAYRRVINAPRRKRHLLLKTILALVLLLVLFAAGLYFMPVTALGGQSAPGATAELPGGYTHVLLIGVDTNKDETSRSDTMMIMSVGKGQVKLTSLQRDTGVRIEGRSGLTRLNAAYTYGGAELLMKTINQNFGFDISLYALVDYDSFPELIDLLGGVDIEGITLEEIEPLNHNIRDVLWRRYHAGELTQEEITLIYLRDEVTAPGDLHLNGLQALGYSRIRKTDSDYMRTLRQRKVISAALKSLKSAGPITLLRLASEGLKCVETNMNLIQLVSLGEKALLASSVGQSRLPVNGTYRDEGSMFFDVDYRKNRDAFIEFVYGDD